MLNLAAFAIMAALGFYYELSWSYFLLLTMGSLLSVVAGFASFSRGSRFAQGRGDAVAFLCMMAALVGAIAIASLNGLWWGLASAILFWPTMYRLGVQILALAVGSSFERERTESPCPSSPDAQFNSAHEPDAIPQSQSSFAVPPLPLHLQGQSGAVLEPIQVEAGAKTEIALFLLDDPEFAEQQLIGDLEFECSADLDDVIAFERRHRMVATACVLKCRADDVVKAIGFRDGHCRHYVSAA